MTSQRYAGKVVSVLQFYFLLLFLFTGYRMLLIVTSTKSDIQLPEVFLTGLRFDARWASLLTLPVIIIFFVQLLLRKINLNVFLRWYAVSALVLLLLLITLDFYYYQYTSSRLSPVLLEIISPFSVAVKMAWQSYPVITVGFLIAIVTWLLYKFLMKRIFADTSVQAFSRVNGMQAVLLLLFFCIAAWGSLKKYPLTWSDAFHHPASGVLVLNPAESFFYGLFYHDKAAPVATSTDYQLIKQVVQFDSVRFKQTEGVKKQFAAASANVNVVVILAESLSSYKTSLVPKQQLNPTPFLKSLADSSYYFSNCFTPHYGTARAVWNLFTGVPDVNWNKLATHQLSATNRSVLLNQMPFSKKYYLLGGDGTWADIKGFLHTNVDAIQVMEQFQMTAKPVSVWGVDDYDLLMQANELFSTTDSSFFAVVQTASNHQPYFIPSTAKQLGFEKRMQQQSELLEFGFTGNDEYNAVRYLDFCLRSFFKAASTADYFKNTIFIIVGDHGTVGHAATVMHPDWDLFKLNMLHVPLLFYKWGISGATDSSLCSIQDILPTVQGLVNETTNSTITGVDLFSGHYKTGQLFMLQDLHQLGWVSNNVRLLTTYANGTIQNTVSNQHTRMADSIASLALATYKIYAAKNR